MSIFFYFFFFNDTATTEIYTLSLHDALPIFKDAIADITLQQVLTRPDEFDVIATTNLNGDYLSDALDRKSTRLNSSHLGISYAVFCLKKKKHSDQHHNAIHRGSSSNPNPQLE